MSIATDRADAETLEHIGRNPGCARRNGRGQANVHVNNAATTRLANAGLVTVTARGRLYLTEAGTQAWWQPAPRPAGQHDAWCVAGILACDPRCPGYVAPVACGIRDCDCHLVTS
jgi:hypothetical protein